MKWTGPTFTKGKAKEKAERMAVEQGHGDEEQAFRIAKINGKKKAKEKKKGKRQAETNLLPVHGPHRH